MAEKNSQLIRIVKGLNLDWAKEYIVDQGSFLKNCVTGYNLVGNSGGTIQFGENNNTGIITPVIGASTQVGGELYPAGQSLCIGAKYDRRLNQLFYFLWNSNNDHTFWVYDFSDVNV